MLRFNREAVQGNHSPSTQIDSFSLKYDNVSEAVAVTDVGGTIRYVNRAFVALTGYSASDAVGRSPRILKSGKHDAFFYQDLWRHLLAGNVWRGEIVNRKKDGANYIDEQTIIPIRRNDGSIGWFISIRHDRTIEYHAHVEKTKLEEEIAFPAKIEQLGQIAVSSRDLLARALDLFLTLSELQSRSSGVAFEVVPNQGILKLVTTIGCFSPQFLAEEATIPLGKCLCGRAAVEGRVLVCENCFTDPRHEIQWLGMKAHGHYTIPIQASGRVYGVVNLYTGMDLDTSEQRIAFLSESGAQLGRILEAKFVISSK